MILGDPSKDDRPLVEDQALRLKTLIMNRRILICMLDMQILERSNLSLCPDLKKAILKRQQLRGFRDPRLRREKQVSPEL